MPLSHSTDNGGEDNDLAKLKIKRLREDFVVNEVSNFEISSGQFAVYRLDKEGIGTPEAINEILRSWNLPRHAIAYGGLRDRHAVTSQTITIHRGPKQALNQRSFTLAYIGQAPREFRAADIAANQFTIALRNLQPDQAERMLASLPVAATGVPNYFDDQRFGSLGESRQFVAHPWCLGDYERTLFLAIAEANVHDAPREREQKALLRNFWGNWKTCKDKLDRSHRRSIVTYLLDHPTDFRRAVALLRIDLRSLYVAAFQSQLWNELVGRLWQLELGNDTVMQLEGAGGPLVFPKLYHSETAAKFRDMSVPLPSARQHQWPGQTLTLLEQVLERYGMQPNQIRLKFPRDTFFSKGQRRVLLVPINLVGKVSQDELETQDRCKLSIEFSLERGCYATMLLKWLEHFSKLS